MARKAQQLRPVMTRIPETLRRRLERAAALNYRSMNTEIIHRLERSFFLDPESRTTLDEYRMLRDLGDYMTRQGEEIAPLSGGKSLAEFNEKVDRLIAIESERIEREKKKGEKKK